MAAPFHSRLAIYCHSNRLSMCELVHWFTRALKQRFQTMASLFVDDMRWYRGKIVPLCFYQQVPAIDEMSREAGKHGFAGFKLSHSKPRVAGDIILKTLLNISRGLASWRCQLCPQTCKITICLSLTEILGWKKYCFFKQTCCALNQLMSLVLP